MDYYIDGHSWVDQEEHSGCTVTISKCEVCGKQEITWKGGQEITNEDNLK